MARSRRRSSVYRTDYQDLIRRVREARQEAGLTQKEVASALGRPLSFVSKCELGERRIDPIDLLDFADLYGKPFEYFFPRARGARKKPSAVSSSRKPDG
jgi:transcriptional regulator with XRE-family HTH domain